MFEAWTLVQGFLVGHRICRRFLMVNDAELTFTRAPVTLFASGLIFRVYLSGNLNVVLIFSYVLFVMCV